MGLKAGAFKVGRSEQDMRLAEVFERAASLAPAYLESGGEVAAMTAISQSRIVTAYLNPQAPVVLGGKS